MNESIAGDILSWLRAGYPEGIPAKDYHPVLALLKRTVPEQDYHEVVGALAAAGSESHAAVVNSVPETEPDEADVRLVASRLALAGWPLGRPNAGTTSAAPVPGPLARVVAWLRAGYPQGVPATDYVPLLALLRRRLSEKEAATIATELIAEGETLPDGSRVPIARTDAQVLISKVLDDLPTELDVERVRKRLEGSGWPLDG